MYLHIGNDVIIRKDKIIAIFNLEKINKGKVFEEFLANVYIQKSDFSEKEPKSMILIEDEGVTKAYYSGISSITLQKR